MFSEIISPIMAFYFIMLIVSTHSGSRTRSQIISVLFYLIELIQIKNLTLENYF